MQFFFSTFSERHTVLSHGCPPILEGVVLCGFVVCWCCFGCCRAPNSVYFSIIACASVLVVNPTTESSQAETLKWKLTVGVACFGVAVGALSLGWALSGTGKLNKT